MKVLMVNGGANRHGCTYTALSEIARVLNEHLIETEIFQLGGDVTTRDCTGCGACLEEGMENKCIIDDKVNTFIQKAKSANGFIFGSPVYYAHPSGRLLNFMDRAFFASKGIFEFKPAAAIVSARRAGTTSALEPIMKHFTISQMPVVSANYWPMVHGTTPAEVKQDLEGMQTMRILGLNMAWMLHCIEAGKKVGIKKPEAEEKIRTNFIR